MAPVAKASVSGCCKISYGHALTKGAILTTFELDGCKCVSIRAVFGFLKIYGIKTYNLKSLSISLKN
jgi:hypothetical protein